MSTAFPQKPIVTMLSGLVYRRRPPSLKWCRICQKCRLDGTERRNDHQPECRKDSKLAVALLEASIACATKAVGMITSILAS
ncbi:hypothetical protein ABIE33_003264 [Ensifer sp. 4252]